MSTVDNSAEIEEKVNTIGAQYFFLVFSFTVVKFVLFD